MPPLKFTVEITLYQRRCCDCRRWFATESENLYACAQCGKDRLDAANREIEELQRTIRALRGHLARRKKGGNHGAR